MITRLLSPIHAMYLRISSYPHISLFFVSLCLSATSAQAENWPQWRGADGTGISHETNLSTESSETKGMPTFEMSAKAQNFVTYGIVAFISAMTPSMQEQMSVWMSMADELRFYVV